MRQAIRRRGTEQASLSTSPHSLLNQVSFEMCGGAFMNRPFEGDHRNPFDCRHVDLDQVFTVNHVCLGDLTLRPMLLGHRDVDLARVDVTNFPEVQGGGMAQYATRTHRPKRRLHVPSQRTRRKKRNPVDPLADTLKPTTPRHLRNRVVRIPNSTSISKGEKPMLISRKFSQFCKAIGRHTLKIVHFVLFQTDLLPMTGVVTHHAAKKPPLR